MGFVTQSGTLVVDRAKFVPYVEKLIRDNAGIHPNDAERLVKIARTADRLAIAWWDPRLECGCLVGTLEAERFGTDSDNWSIFGFSDPDVELLPRDIALYQLGISFVAQIPQLLDNPLDQSIERVTIID